MPTFFSELRRRNVLGVAAAYALVAWIIIEAGSVLLPTFGAPEWAFKVYVMVVLAGFVVALFLAWVFDFTEDGIKRDKDADPQEPPEFRHRSYGMIIGLLVIALTISITFNVTGIRHSTIPTTEPLRQWIAVLPLVNLSTNAENAVFADGIHDDLLTKLANNSALKVISRTSVLKYRNTDMNIREIGEELNVDAILEGAVQRVGDTVRINMQLVDAKTDEHLWAKTYDRKLTMEDIFAIQSDISSAISIALHAALNPEQEGRNSRIPTNNLVAYNLYVKARSNMALREHSNALAAREQFEQAVALDPNFAEAHAGLATSVLLLYINSKSIDREEAIEITKHELDIALELNPNLADAYATLGLLKLNSWDHMGPGTEMKEQAAAAFNKALELNPNHASAAMWYAALRESENKTQEAIALYEKSKELDPLGRIPYANLPKLYASLGDNDKALQQWIRATEIHPDWSTLDEYIAVHLHKLGRMDEALAWFHHARELTNGSLMGNDLDAGIYVAFGDPERASEILMELPDDHPLADLRNGVNLLINGDPEGALKLLLSAAKERPTQSPYMSNAISNVALLTGDLETARKYLLLKHPYMAEDDKFEVNIGNARALVGFAYVTGKLGQQQLANQLLNKALSALGEMPRQGVAGYGILDVQILTLLGEHEKAIAAFGEAVEAGFRSSVGYDYWILAHDPYLKSLRSDDRFTALVEVIETDVQRMKNRVDLAQDSGDWEALRQLAVRQVDPTTPI